MVQFFPDVLFGMPFEVGRTVAWIVAMCALVRFLFAVNEEVGLQTISSGKWLITLWTLVLSLPGVNEVVGLQMMIQTKWLVTLWATVLFDTRVDLFVMEKTAPPCKCLRTQVTRCLFSDNTSSCAWRSLLTVSNCCTELLSLSHKFDGGPLWRTIIRRNSIIYGGCHSGHLSIHRSYEIFVGSFGFGNICNGKKTDEDAHSSVEVSATTSESDSLATAP